MRGLPPARAACSTGSSGPWTTGVARARSGTTPRGVASPLAIDCPPLAGPADEAWLAGAITESAETAGAAWAHGEHYALVALAVDETTWAAWLQARR